MEKLQFAEEFSTLPFGADSDASPDNGAAFRPLITKRFKESYQNGKYGLEVVMDDMIVPLADFMKAGFGEFAKQMKEEGVDVNRDNLKFSGELSEYEVLLDVLWDIIEKRKALAATSANGATAARALAPSA